MHRLSTATVAMLLFGGTASGAAQVPPAGPAAAAGSQVTFTFTGAPQAYTVPDGVTSLTIEACGARGGQSLANVDGLFGTGGIGGWASRTITVASGEVLQVNVGGDGALDVAGWNGGGQPTPFPASIGGGGAAGGGGGASDVRRGVGALSDRVVVGGGGGGGGIFFGGGILEDRPLPGGAGGGVTGGDADDEVAGASQSGPGTNALRPTSNGALGLGGSGDGVGVAPFGGAAAGGGGGYYGGAGGFSILLETGYVGAGSGGSGLGDALAPGVCTGGAYVTISADGLPSILPSGVGVVEGDAGSETVLLPVYLSEPVDHDVTVEWTTAALPAASGLAQAGTDFVAAAGTVRFAPGETVAFVPIEILFDDVDEPPLLWGEWGIVLFSRPIGATIDTSGFFGAGLFIIVDDD